MTDGDAMVVSALISFFVTIMCLIAHTALRHIDWGRRR
jgi:hypothetical protein